MMGAASPRPAGGPAALSCQLRVETAALHEKVEALLGLPRTVDGRNYGAWLGRFYGLYEPLEHVLAAFPDWATLGLETEDGRRSACAAGDLAALGLDCALLPRISPASLPDLPSFAHALGARYVLEGATLGARLILRDIEARIGPPIRGATRFFAGHGDATGPRWKNVCAALDGFGGQRPELRPDVVTGAQKVFGTFLIWFAPFRAGADGTP